MSLMFAHNVWTDRRNFRKPKGNNRSYFSSYLADSGYVEVTFLEPRYKMYSAALNLCFRGIHSTTNELLCNPFLSSVRRQLNNKFASLAFLTFHLYLTTMHLDNVVSQRQPQSRSL